MPKRLYVLYAAALVLFCAMQLWFLSVTIRTPYIGISLSPEADRTWTIIQVDRESAGEDAGLLPGDRILRVDGKAPEENKKITMYHSLDQVRDVEVMRDGRPFVIHLHLADGAVNLDYMPLLEEGICLVLAAFLGIRLRRSPSGRLLAAAFLTAGMVYMSIGASSRGDTWAKLSITGFMTLLPVVFMHFLYRFFQEKSGLPMPFRKLKRMYGFVLGVMLLRLLVFVPPISYPAYRLNAVVTLVLFVVGFLYIIGFLGSLYLKYRNAGTYLTSLIRSVWASLFVSFTPVVFLSFLPGILFGRMPVDAVYTSWFILFFPVSFAYLIASNQLFDIGLVFRRFLFAAVLGLGPSAMFCGVYALLFYDRTSVIEIAFVFLGCTILMTVLLYSAEYFTSRLEAIFFPKKYALRTSLRKIAKNLGSISSMRELGDIILADIVQTLEVRGGAFVFQYREETEVIHAGEIDSGEVRRSIASHQAGPGHSAYTVLEISRNEEYTSYLVISRKKTNTLMGQEELNWLGLIISYLEVSLENVHLIRKLKTRLQLLANQPPEEESVQDFQWFRKIMFELQEEERTRIATDLHDTTMQDLFFLKGRMSAVMQKHAHTEEDRKSWTNMLEFVDLINAGLRQTCFELNPHLLVEAGLITTVEKYMENEAFDTPFRIDFLTEPGAVLVESLDLMAKRHLLRIVQELMNNAKKHSQAESVRFRLSASQGQIRLIYEDDGVGMGSAPDKQPGIRGSGIGMVQMRGRVNLLQGRMEIMPGGANPGTRIEITLPLRQSAAG